jgi:hypothetical protein
VPPPSNQITGEWGGPAIELTDSSAARAIVLNHFCDQEIFPAPKVDSTGFFDAHGVVMETTNSLAAGDSVHIFGTIHGNTMDLYATLTSNEGKGTPPHTVLIRNQPPDKSLIICPA